MHTSHDRQSVARMMLTDVRGSCGSSNVGRYQPYLV